MKYVLLAFVIAVSLSFALPSYSAPVSMMRATFTPLPTSGPLATPAPTPTDIVYAYPAPDEKKHSGDNPTPVSSPLRRNAPCTSLACRYLKDRT